MPDVRGWRKNFGVLAPSTNTMVEPDFYMMGVSGVTAHISRIYIWQTPAAIGKALSPQINVRAG